MEASGKMGVLDRMLRKLKERGHRVTLFSQYNRMLDVIEDYLIYRGYKCALLSVLLLASMAHEVHGCMSESALDVCRAIVDVALTCKYHLML